MSEDLGRQLNEEGFTLFELLIVIIILAILAAIVAFSVGTTNAGALTSSCQSDAKALETALQEYNTDVGQYPKPGTGLLGYDGTPATGLTQQFTAQGTTVGPFLRQLSNTNHYQIVTDGLGNVFVYPPYPAHIPTGAGAMASTDVGLEVFGDPTKDRSP